MKSIAIICLILAAISICLIYHGAYLICCSRSVQKGIFGLIETLGGLITTLFLIYTSGNF